MTETTDSRQIGMMTQAILAKYQVDNLQLEIDLSSALLAYLREKQAGTPTGKIREKVLAAMEIAAAKSTKYDDMARRVKQALGLEVTGRSRYDGMMEFLLKRDAAGEAIEVYSQWQNDNPYKAPASFKIAERPELLEETWGMAFVKKTDERRPEYDTNGILKSW